MFLHYLYIMLNLHGISDVYRVEWENLQIRIMSEPDSFLVHSGTAELVNYYLSSRQFNPIEMDSKRETTVEFKKAIRRVPPEQRRRAFQDMGELKFEYETIVVQVPIVRNKNIIDFANLRTSTYSMGWSPKRWGLKPDMITLDIDVKGYGFNYADDEQNVASMIESERAKVDQWIGWVNGDVNRENANLEAQLREFIDQRRSKIQRDTSKMESLIKRINIPLKKTESEAVQRIRVDQKPLVKKLRPSPKNQEEYVLDRQKVIDIVSVIDSQGRQFEKTPSTYKNSGEEDLRNVILVGLNTLFEGKATGETFSANGKTDIYLNIDKGNILVCECKIWAGESVYNETIEQLLGYLPWRHNFGIVISFVKLKNLTKILQQIPGIIEKHGSFTTGVKEYHETHFMSQHKLNQDDDKQVEIHHLFYNLYQ